MRALAAVLVLAGCGAPMKVGEACDEILKTTCQRAVDCIGGTTADRATCINAGQGPCCVDKGLCQRDVKDPVAVSKCAAANTAIDCAEWRAFAANPSTTPQPIPSVCVGVAAPR